MPVCPLGAQAIDQGTPLFSVCDYLAFFPSFSRCISSPLFPFLCLFARCSDAFLFASSVGGYNTIQYNTIQYNTIQYNTIQYNTIQYNTIQLFPCDRSKGGGFWRFHSVSYPPPFVFLLMSCRFAIFMFIPSNIFTHTCYNMVNLNDQFTPTKELKCHSPGRRLSSNYNIKYIEACMTNKFK